MEELSASQVASADDGRHAERDSRGAATSDDAVIHTSCNLQTARNAVTMKQRVGFPRSKGQKQATRTFKFGGKALLIRQEVDEAELSMKREGMEEYAGVGMVVWNSGRCLAEFLIAEYSAEQGGMGGLSCLELGAGTGVPGIATAMHGASSVVLTDVEHIVPLLQENCDLNASSIARECTLEVMLSLVYRWRGYYYHRWSLLALLLYIVMTLSVSCLLPIQVCSYRWGESTEGDQLSLPPESPLRRPSFDLILAADVLYRRECHTALAQSIVRYSSPDSITFLLYQDRGLGEQDFIQRLAPEHGLQCERVAHQHLPKYHASFTGKLFLYKIRSINPKKKDA